MFVFSSEKVIECFFFPCVVGLLLFFIHFPNAFKFYLKVYEFVFHVFYCVYYSQQLLLTFWDFLGGIFVCQKMTGVLGFQF